MRARNMYLKKVLKHYFTKMTCFFPDFYAFSNNNLIFLGCDGSRKVLVTKTGSSKALMMIKHPEGRIEEWKLNFSDYGLVLVRKDRVFCVENKESCFLEKAKAF